VIAADSTIDGSFEEQEKTPPFRFRVSASVLVYKIMALEQFVAERLFVAAA
jgi:hypothetical protein